VSLDFTEKSPKTHQYQGKERFVVEGSVNLISGYACSKFLIDVGIIPFLNPSFFLLPMCVFWCYPHCHVVVLKMPDLH
jgi:hypothetical protein